MTRSSATSSTTSAMDLSLPVWREFWYPVAFAEDLAGGPLRRTVLGEHLVIWDATPPGVDGAPGEVAVVGAARDRCPHRDAALSQGWTCEGRIVCPYHGWQFEAAGPVAVVPQTPAITSFPARYAIDAVAAEVRYGAVWVCLADAPARTVPDLIDGARDGWRTIREFDEEWATAPARLMENSFDPAHTVFVHRATFGDTSRPDVDVPAVARTDGGMAITSDLSVANPDFARSTTGEQADRTVRSTVTEWHAPFLRVLRSSYPGGTVHGIVTAATPVGPDRLRLVQWAVRNDTEAEAPAADVVAFDRRVTWEDQALLEGIATPYSSSLDANVHLKVDRPTVEMRRIYAEMAAGTWSGLAPGPIPVVDLSWAAAPGPQRGALVAQVAAACADTGFVVVSGHGVPDELIDEVYRASAAFFALPLEEKQRCTPDGWDRFCGFAGVERGREPGGGPPDLKEMYHVNRHDDLDAAVAAGLPHEVALGQAPNLWPERPAGFEAAWRAYYAAMEGLALRILHVMALALQLPEGALDHLVDGHLSNLAANWYPPQTEAPEPGQVRAGHHVDFSLLTILYQDAAPGGLEVRTRSGGWVPVPHRPGSFVVNLGDLTNRLTNDRWTATPHRVVNPEPADGAGAGRISIPYFVMPAWGALIECVPTCMPADGSAPRYPSVVAGPHAEERRSGRRAATAV